MHATRRFLRRAALAASLLVASTDPDVAARAGDAPRPLAAIEDDLVADDPAVRARAAAELTDRFPDGAVAVPMLVDLLDDEAPEVGAAAARAIDAMAVAAAIPMAAFYADEANWKDGSRLSAVTLSGEPPGERAFDTNGLRLEKEGPSASEIAASALARRPAESAWLLDVARNPANANRTLAAAALTLHGMDAVTERQLATPENPGRSKAAFAAADLLASDLDLKSWSGARLLARLRSTDEAVLAELVKTLTAEKLSHARDRSGKSLSFAPLGAAWALYETGAGAASVAPALLRRLKGDTDSATAEFLGRALFRMGKQAELVALLARDDITSHTLTRVLATEKRAAAVLVPRLVGKLKGPRTIESALALLDLADLGPLAGDALSAIKRRLKDLDEAHRWEELSFVDAILAISPTDADGYKLLESWLDRAQDANELRRPVQLLTERAPPTPKVVRRLLAFLSAEAADEKDAQPDVIGAIARCGPAAKAAVVDLVRITANADKRCAEFWNRPRAVSKRRDAVVALGRIGPGAAAALPALDQLRTKGDETIRVAAAQAVRRIRK